jgi:hypothetical protein
MARYICSYLVKVPVEELKPLLREVLENCRFEVIYDTIEYVMAKEIPGQVSFSKLVTVEALIDHTKAKNQEVKVQLVVKNDELPLQVNNHCHQLFYQLQDFVGQNQQWQLLENIPN